jgi:hypothetical protein
VNSNRLSPSGRRRQFDPVESGGEAPDEA